MLTKDLDKFVGMNRCKAVVDNLRESVCNWNKKDSTKSIGGCAAFVFVSSIVNLIAAFSILHIDNQSNM